MELIEILNELQNDEASLLEPIHIGELEIVSGKIVACDPLVEPDAPAFERMVPKGKFPVYLLVDSYDEIACAQILFSDKPIATLEMATLPGQSLAELEEGYIYGYPVDAGLGCFMDEEAGKLLTEATDLLTQNDSNANYYDNVIDGELGEQAHCDHRPNKNSSLNVLIFQSGWGDGVYASYWGLDADGNLVTLVTDFGLLDAEELDEDAFGEADADED